MEAKFKKNITFCLNDLRKIMNLDGSLVFKYIDGEYHKVNSSNYTEYTWVKNSGMFEIRNETMVLKDLLCSILNNEKIYYEGEEVCSRSENILEFYDIFLSYEENSNYLFRLATFEDLKQLKRLTMDFGDNFFDLKIKSIKSVISGISIEV